MSIAGPATTEPRSPEAWWPLFQQAMRHGDGEEVLRLYEPGAVFAPATGNILTGQTELRTVLEPLASARADFQVTIRKIIQSKDGQGRAGHVDVPGWDRRRAN